ncbi:uncharacterized protein TEOVI_000578900 [Trypanosoma equiperdum]|uniref:Transmembrane protein n=1 Tax=Trypanosoma equiperdum TaxID=5694 RepID=A0A1G4I585_TRYEQ|nr:hypothetical protein, conserved [Trypanosoma equiperdum]
MGHLIQQSLVGWHLWFHRFILFFFLAFALSSLLLFTFLLFPFLFFFAQIPRSRFTADRGTLLQRIKCYRRGGREGGEKPLGLYVCETPLTNCCFAFLTPFLFFAFYFFFSVAFGCTILPSIPLLFSDLFTDPSPCNTCAAVCAIG